MEGRARPQRSGTRARYVAASVAVEAPQARVQAGILGRLPRQAGQLRRAGPALRQARPRGRTMRAPIERVRERHNKRPLNDLSDEELSTLIELDAALGGIVEQRLGAPLAMIGE